MGTGRMLQSLKDRIAPPCRVQIVAPTDSWILQKMGLELANRIPFAELSDWKPDPRRKWDITYFVNYALYEPSENAGMTGGYFTHKENERFEEVASQMDFAVCMSRKYVPVARAACQNTHCIHPGVDLDAFTPRLRLGIVGRTYRSGRKGEDLYAKLEKLPYVDLRKTEGDIPEDQLPDFYNDLDYVLITSRIEGGPMCLLEGFACGKEVITPDVGLVGEFETGIHLYDRDRPETLFEILAGLHAKRLAVRRQVEELSWQRFADAHRALFLELVKPAMR